MRESSRVAEDDRVNSSDSALPFLGREALASGLVTTHRLRTAARRLFPGVYIDAATRIELRSLVHAAYLWSPHGSVVAGLGAALLHRERWYAPESVEREIDIYSVGTPHAADGVRVRRLAHALPTDHVVTVDGVRVTSVARTAVDVARWEDDDDKAIAMIDAICNRGKTEVRAVAAVAAAMRGGHGVNRVRNLLRWCDERADSPPETRLRLMLLRAGLPSPTPQLIIYNEFGVKITKSDLGYEEQKVAIFYDSELHRQKSNWEFDAWVNAQLTELGWIEIRVTAQMMRSPQMLIRQIASALKRGGAGR